MAGSADNDRIDGYSAGRVLRIDGAQPLSIAWVKALEDVCDRAEDHVGTGAVAVVHVSGAPTGPAWLAGLNVALVSKWERALRRLERLAMPTLASVRGDCGGIALDVLLATDARIADPDLRLLISSGSEAIWPGMSCFRLVREVGVARIRRAVLFGTPIEAAEALSLGLIDQVTDDPDGALAAMSGSLTARSGSELAIRRQLMFDAVVTSFDDALGPHLAACDRTMRRNSAGVGS